MQNVINNNYINKLISLIRKHKTWNPLHSKVQLGNLNLQLRKILPGKQILRK